MSRLPRLIVAATLGLAACEVSPLTNQVAVGEEPYLVFVGEGRDGQTDLFVGPDAGGQTVRLTFSRNPESSPALDPTGVMVAYLRGWPERAEPPELVVMNLLSAAERSTAVPIALGAPDRVAWAPDGRRVFVRVAGGVLASPAPPDRFELTPLAAAERAEADSAFAVLVGDPPRGMVVPCADRPDALCVALGGEEALLAAGARDPVRWSGDSVGYLAGGRFEVRPLAGGRARRLEWVHAPANLRQPTRFPGPPEG